MVYRYSFAQSSFETTEEEVDAMNTRTKLVEMKINFAFDDDRLILTKNVKPKVRDYQINIVGPICMGKKYRECQG